MGFAQNDLELKGLSIYVLFVIFPSACITQNGQGNRFKVILILVFKLTRRWRHQSIFKNAVFQLPEYIEGWGHQKMTKNGQEN